MNGKTCTKCGAFKELECFARQQGRKDGRRAYCKPCGVAATVAWQKENPEKRRARQNKWYLANKQQARAAIEKWRKENVEKQQIATRNWGLLNRDRRAATLAKRRAAKLQRTPGWLSLADFEAMAFIYQLARILSEASGIPHHVDHEIPLQGELVSGLHVPSNLQVITASENTSKSNRWIPE